MKGGSHMFVRTLNGLSLRTAFAVAWVSLAVILITGCSGSIDTCGDLAKALQREGIPWDTSEPIDLKGMSYAKIDESLVLTGEMVHMEIFRISDRRTFDNFGRAAVLLGAAELKTGKRLPGRPNIYHHEPFVIIVRMEPREGTVQVALESVF